MWRSFLHYKLSQANFEGSAEELLKKRNIDDGISKTNKQKTSLKMLRVSSIRERITWKRIALKLGIIQDLQGRDE